MRDTGEMGERRERNERRRTQKREERGGKEERKGEEKGEEINIVYFCRGIRRTREESVFHRLYLERDAVFGKGICNYRKLL